MRKLTVALIAISFVGCLDYTSIIKMEPDGSGSLSIELRLPTGGDNSIQVDKFTWEPEDASGWKVKVFEVDTLDTVVRIKIDGEFKSLVDFKPPLILDIPSVVGDIFNFDPDSFSLTREEIPSGYRYHLYRSCFSEGNITFSISVEGTDPDAYKWREELELPGKIISHNADKSRGNTLIWERRTNDVYKKGLVMEAVWEVGNTN